jgi:hypothetical protein
MHVPSPSLFYHIHIGRQQHCISVIVSSETTVQHNTTVRQWSGCNYWKGMATATVQPRYSTTLTYLCVAKQQE